MTATRALASQRRGLSGFCFIVDPHDIWPAGQASVFQASLHFAQPAQTREVRRRRSVGVLPVASAQVDQAASEVETLRGPDAERGSVATVSGDVYVPYHYCPIDLQIRAA